MAPVPLTLSQSEYEAIQQCDAFIVREYANEVTGTRFARPVAWGTQEDMNEQNNDPATSLVIVPVGFRLVVQRVVTRQEMKLI
jgi:hypothetical protein